MGNDHMETIGELRWCVHDGLVSLSGPRFADGRGSVAWIADREGALGIPRAKRQLHSASPQRQHARGK